MVSGCKETEEMAWSSPYLESLQTLSLQDLVKEAEKVYHKSETEEVKRERV